MLQLIYEITNLFIYCYPYISYRIVIVIVNKNHTEVVPVSPTPVVTTTTPNTVIVAPTTVPKFTWQFAADKALTLDGLPKTSISLKVVYADGRTETKIIATVPGSCNELPDADKDSVKGSKNIQCYAAGAGDRFKIVQGLTSYLVQHQEFEEGSPEYNPPVQPYRTVVEFSF